MAFGQGLSFSISGKKRAKTGIFGLQCGQPAAAEPVFLLSGAKTTRKRWCTFCVSLLRKEITKKSNVGEWNHKQRRKQIESDNFVPFKILIYSY